MTKCPDETSHLCTCRKCKCLLLPRTRSAAHKATVAIAPYNRGVLVLTSILPFYVKSLPDTHPHANLFADAIVALNLIFCSNACGCVSNYNRFITLVKHPGLRVSCLFIFQKFEYSQKENLGIAKTRPNSSCFETRIGEFRITDA